MVDGKIITNDDSSRKIKDMIFVIRGVQVILDSDVALLYGYETKKLNQTVKRNKKRFPENFCFQLTEEEIQFLRSQIATSKGKEILRSQIVTLKEKMVEVNIVNIFLMFLRSKELLC